MEYEIVTLEEKTVVGLIARTNNAAPDMSIVIGGLWKSFYEDGIYAQIQNKTNEKAMGIYSDYAGDEKDDYTVTVACEVTGAEMIPQGAVSKTIPAGTYARFVVRGHMQEAVAQFWQELWQMDLNRKFMCDFEEYQNGDMEHAEIHMYIGIE